MVNIASTRTMVNNRVFNVNKAVSSNLLQVAEIELETKRGDDIELHLNELKEDIEYLKENNKRKIDNFFKNYNCSYYQSESFRNSLLNNKVEIQKKKKLIAEIEKTFTRLLAENEYRKIINKFMYLHNTNVCLDNELDLDINITKVEHYNVN